MKGLYNNNYQLLSFNNSLFSILNFNSFFNLNIFLSSPIITFNSNFFFHPKKNSLEPGELKSFFDHILYLQMFLNSFTNSFSKLKKIYFTKLKKSNFKFRKRKNVYFSLIYSSKPFNNLLFFKNILNFVLFFNSISKRLYQIYSLKTLFFKLTFRNGILTFYFLNPQYYSCYIQNKKIIKKNLITKMHIYFPLKKKLYMYSLLKNFYNFIFK